MKDKRTQRLNSEFRRYIYDVLKNEVKNPEITEMFTIMEVETAGDLRYADVLVSIYSTDQAKKEKTFEAIKDSAGIVRRRISSIMHIRTVPEFRFKLDTSMEYGQRIDEILVKINEKLHD